jgi:hypothetical protein
MSEVVLSNGHFVMGTIGRFNGEVWESIETQEAVPIVSLGEVDGYCYGVIALTDLPVRWHPHEVTLTLYEEVLL